MSLIDPRRWRHHWEAVSVLKRVCSLATLYEVRSHGAEQELLAISKKSSDARLTKVWRWRKEFSGINLVRSRQCRHFNDEETRTIYVAPKGLFPECGKTTRLDVLPIGLSSGRVSSLDADTCLKRSSSVNSLAIDPESTIYVEALPTISTVSASIILGVAIWTPISKIRS